MQIKRFEAKNMTTALGLVKDELGPDAVILSARSLRKGKGFFGSMKYAGVEVTAAIDNQRLFGKKNNSASRKNTYHHRERVRYQDPYRVEQNEVIRATGYPGQHAVDQQRYLTRRKSNSGRDHELLSSLYQQILAQEVDRSIASELIEDIRRNPAPLDKFDGEGLKTYLTSTLEEMGVLVDEDVFAVGKPRILAFIGSTGVGKTTTIAKLAALQSRRYQKSVALITLDNYGITATEQLKTYAQIIGIPLETAVNFTELKHSVKKYSDKELILIDTPGINPRNPGLIQNLKRYFAKLSDLQIHLVLSATTKENDLIGIMEALKVIHIHRLLFTKIDESRTYGNMVNLLIGTKIPLSFLGCGRKVPDDIEAGSTEKLVALLFNSPGEPIQKTAASPNRSNNQIVNLENLPEVKTRFAANKNSDIYHCLDCKMSKSIKSEEIIIFSSAQEAEAQNYLPCSRCKPDRQQYRDHLGRTTEKMKFSSYL